MTQKGADRDDRSIDRLKANFESAGYRCEIDEDGDLRIVGDVVVLLMAGGGDLLKFVSMYRLTDEADEYRAGELERRVNEGIDTVKARLSIDFRMLTISWIVNTEGGITDENLVSTFRKFQIFVRQAEIFDTDDLLE